MRRERQVLLLAALLTIASSIAQAQNAQFFWKSTSGLLQHPTLSDDGRYLVGNGAASLNAWDLQTGKLMKSVYAQVKVPTSTFIPGTQSLISHTGVGGSAIPQRWSFPGLVPITTYTANLSAQFVPVPGGLTVLAADGGTIVERAVTNLDAIRTIPLPAAVCAISRNGQWVSAIDAQGTARVFSYGAQQVTGIFPTAFSPVQTVVTNNGRLVYTITGDGVVRGWSTVINDLVFYAPGLAQSTMALTPDDQFLVVSSPSQGAFVFSTATGALVRNFATLPIAYSSLLSQDGQVLYVTGADSMNLSQIRGFNVTTGNLHQSLSTIIDGTDAFLQTAGSVLAVVKATGAQNVMQSLSTSDGSEVGRVSGPLVYKAVDTTGSFYARQKSSSEVEIVRRADESVVKSISSAGTVRHCAFSPDRLYFVVVTDLDSGMIQCAFYSTSGWSFSHNVTIPDFNALSFDYSPDGNYYWLRTSSQSGQPSLMLLNTAFNSPMYFPAGHQPVGCALNKFYTYTGNSVVIWDATTGSTTGAFVCPEPAVAVSPLGNVLVSASGLTGSPRDPTLNFRSTSTGEILATTKLPLNPATKVKYAFDGKSLVVWGGPSSNFLARIQDPLVQSVFVPPTQLAVSLGQVSSGSVSDLANEDSAALRVCKFIVPNQAMPSIQFTVTGYSPSSNLNSLVLIARVKMNTAGTFSQKLEMYDWVADRWDPFDTRSDLLSTNYQTFASAIEPCGRESPSQR